MASWAGALAMMQQYVHDCFFDITCERASEKTTAPRVDGVVTSNTTWDGHIEAMSRLFTKAAEMGFELNDEKGQVNWE